MAFGKTIYAVHPVKPEVKAEANKRGYKLLDARFAPEGEPLMDGQTGERVEASLTAGEPTREDVAKMPKAEVIEWLEAHGVEKPDGPLTDLRAKLTAIMFVEV